MILNYLETLYDCQGNDKLYHTRLIWYYQVNINMCKS